MGRVQSKISLTCLLVINALSACGWNPPRSPEYAAARREVEQMLVGRKRYETGKYTLVPYAERHAEKFMRNKSDRVSLLKAVLARECARYYEIDRVPALPEELRLDPYGKYRPKDYEEFRAEVLSDQLARLSFSEIGRVFEKEPNDISLGAIFIWRNTLKRGGDSEKALATAKRFFELTKGQDARFVGFLGVAYAVGDGRRNWRPGEEIPKGIDLLEEALKMPLHSPMRQSFEIHVETARERLARYRKTGKVDPPS